MLFTDFNGTLGASGSSLISTLMPLVSMALLITSLFPSQLFVGAELHSLILSALFTLLVCSLFDAIIVVADDEDDGIVEGFTLSVVVPSFKLLFTFFDDEILLLMLVDEAAAVVADLDLPSPPELLFDSLSSTENGNTIATHCSWGLGVESVTKNRNFRIKHAAGITVHGYFKFHCYQEKPKICDCDAKRFSFFVCFFF